MRAAMGDNYITVLLVEDNPSDIRLIEEKLKSDDRKRYKTLACKQLTDALTLIGENSIDVVLLDLSLPDFQKLAGLKHLRGGFPDIPVVVLTGCDDEELALQAIKEGAQDYLYKDELSGQLLQRSLHYAIERHKTEECLRQNEAQGRTILENNHDLIWAVNRDQKIIYINSRAKKYFQELYGVVLSAGSPFHNCLPKEQKLLFEKAFNKSIKGDRLSLSDYRPYSNDSYFDISINPIIASNDKVSGVSFFAKDVTARRQSQQSLFEHQAHLKGILETNMDYIIALDRDFCTLVFNEKAAGLFDELQGYELEKGMAILEIMPSKQRHYWENICRRVLAGERITIDDAYFEINDRYFDFIAYPIKLKEGEIKGITFFFRDVTERKISNDGIKESEARFTSLVETMEEGLTYSNQDEVLQFCNDQFCVLTGYKPTELIGKNIYDLLVPDEWKEFHKTKSKLLRQGIKDHYETQLLTKSGKKIWVLISSTPILDKTGSIEGIFSTHTDISNIKQALEDVKKSETKYRTLLQTMHEGMVNVNNINVIQYVNERFCIMTGYNKEDLIGTTIYDLAYEDNDKEIIKQKSELRKLGIGDQYELRLRRKNEDSIWVLINGSPIKDESGNVVGAMGTFTDINDMKVAEQKLKDKNEELNTFVYKASHDLKGPLSSIMGLTNLASSEIGGEVAQKYFQLISKSTMRLERILMELLQTVRIRHTSISYVKLDLPYIVEDVLDSIAASEGYDSIRVEKKLENIPAFYSDRVLLVSILQNLLDNALKYHDRKTSDPYVRLQVYKLGSCLKMVVEDNGPGIIKAHQQKVFEMFYRGNLQANGTGLGLYIVKNAVEKLNGDIMMESEEGKGTRFVITLPWNSSSKDEIDAVAENEASASSLFAVSIEK